MTFDFTDSFLSTIAIFGIYTTSNINSRIGEEDIGVLQGDNLGPHFYNIDIKMRWRLLSQK